MLELDHIAVLAGSLETAVAHCEQALGCVMAPGGQHARFGTHNRLLGLGQGHYLEAIAIDPAAAPLKDPRWFGLDNFAGPARLDKWICRVPDMAVALARWPEAGRPIALTRGDLAWTMAVPETGALPFDGLFPALIEWRSPVAPGDSLPADNRILKRLTVRHPHASALQERLGNILPRDLVQFVEADVPSLEADIDVSGRLWQLT